MSTDEIRAFYLRYIDALNAREFERLGEFVHDEVTLNGAPVARDQIVTELHAIIDAVPDFAWDLRDLIIEGDRLAARLVDTGTPGREWLGLAPGTKGEFAECAFYVLVDGRLKVMWNQFDAQADRRHLGG
jgi:predicted ester cyclase